MPEFTLPQKPQIIIGIDPDCEASGVARIDLPNMLLSYTRLPFIELLNYLDIEMPNVLAKPTLFVVEAGWKNQKSSWHLEDGDNKEVSSRKGYNVGCNHQIGKDIYDYICRGIKDRMDSIPGQWYDCIDQVPLRKIWGEAKDDKKTWDIKDINKKRRKKNEGKISHKDLVELVKNAGLTGMRQGRNHGKQDERDAILLALVHSNLPLRIKL